MYILTYGHNIASPCINMAVLMGSVIYQENRWVGGCNLANHLSFVMAKQKIPYEVVNVHNLPQNWPMGFFRYA
jgi:hypothetical protein